HARPAEGRQGAGRLAASDDPLAAGRRRRLRGRARHQERSWIMTDTPIQPPATRLERIKSFIGDLARPFAIIATSFAASWATIVIAYRVENGNDGAIFIGGVFAG